MARMETQVLKVAGAPTSGRVLQYPVKINNVQTEATLDCGATVNTIDAKLLNRVGGTMKEKPDALLLYGGNYEAKVLGVAELEVKAKGFREKLEFWVVEDLGMLCCLGSNWLKEWNPAVNWNTEEMIFSDGVV